MPSPADPDSTLDPKIQAILDRARAQQDSAVVQQRARNESEARQRRAYKAWLSVSQFRGDEIPEGLTGAAFHRAYAERIVELGHVLQADGWQGRVEAVPSDSDAKTLALSMLRKAMEGDIATVTRLVQEMIDTLFPLGFQADGWLRDGLMYEVLNIQPAPEPPLGWEGHYLEAIETVEDFGKWIDSEFLVQEMVGRGRADRPSDGSKVRNAYRLALKLGLKGVPPEPIGSFTLHDELAILRNLRRLCDDNQQGNHDAEADSGDRGQGVEASSHIADPGQVRVVTTVPLRDGSITTRQELLEYLDYTGEIPLGINPTFPEDGPPWWQRFIEDLYAVMHRLRILWTPAPPYTRLTHREAEDEYQRIRNRLRAEGTSERDNPTRQAPTVLGPLNEGTVHDAIIRALDALLSWAQGHDGKPFGRPSKDEEELSQLDTGLYAACQRASVVIPRCPLSSNYRPFGFSGIPYHIGHLGMTVHLTAQWKQAMRGLWAAVQAGMTGKRGGDQGGMEHAGENSEPNSPAGGQSEVLSPLQYDILQALRDLKATDPEKRATGPDIAKKVGGEVTEQSVKAPLAGLKRRGLVGSQTGRGGGSWLTPQGRDFINSRRPKQ